MRRILVDAARRRRRKKRGGNRRRIELEDADLAAPGNDDLPIDLDEALRRLDQHDRVMARVVELRFFGGLRMSEIADTLELSKRSVEARWTRARAWLFREIRARGHA